MFTTDHFLSTYENYTNIQLFQAHAHLNDYSAEAQEALLLVINNRGGLEKLQQEWEEKIVQQREAARIKKETATLAASGTNLALLKKLITSDILQEEAVSELIEQSYTETAQEKQEIAITPRTVFGSLIGGSIASITGGILWGLQMIQMHKMFAAFFIGLVFYCYGLIKLFTRKSKKNNMVFIATIISVIAALIIGQLLFEGYL